MWVGIGYTIIILKEVGWLDNAEMVCYVTICDFNLKLCKFFLYKLLVNEKDGKGVEFEGNQTIFDSEATELQDIGE